MQLDEIRRLAEERNQAIGREYYPHGAGLKDSLDLASVLNRYSALNSREVVRTVLDALHAASDPTEKRRMAHLLGDCLEGYLHTATSSLDDAIATAESQRTLHVEGTEMPYRQSASVQSNEPSRERRLAIEVARWAVLDELNPQRKASLEAVRKLISGELGYAGYVEFYSELKGIDLPGFGAQMGLFLEDTRELYLGALANWTQAELGVTPESCHRHDLSYLMRAVRFDPYFPEEKLQPTLVNTIANLGFDLASQTNIVLDLEKRPTKSPRAFVVGVQVPDEVYLVVQPKGGRDDYAAILHESGHAEHFGNTRADLPYEFRWLGDYSVTECFAFTMELLTLDPLWLEQHLGMPADVCGSYQKFGYTVLLYLMRRYAAKLEYELQLHDARPLDGKESLYAETLERHLGVKHHPSSYLADVDPGFYCAYYLRAWIMWAQLRKHLRETYGPEWFNSHAAGAFLQQLWGLGMSLPADLLVQQFGYDGLDVGPLLEELTAVLGPTAVVSPA